MELSPLKKIRHKKTAFFDVETYRLSATKKEFAFACLYIDEDNYQFLFTVDDCKKALLQLTNYVIFAHNAEYDLTTVFGNIKQNLDNSAVFIGSSFIAAKKDGVTFYDSFKCFPTNLRSIGEALGCIKGNYNEIQLKRGQRITTAALMYCKRDCEILKKAVDQSFDLIGAIKPTIGSSALFYFRRVFLKKSIHFNELVYKFGESYYGGRTEAFFIGACLGYCYDVNSMYPWAMKQIFPNPDNLTTITSCSVSQLETLLKAKNEGVAKVMVHSNESNQFPPLPLRKNGKLMFVNGEFTGTYNLNELRFAYENKLITIKEVFEVTYSKTNIESPFTEFVDNIYQKRKESTGFYNLLYKLLLNNLYGKFGEKRHGKKTYYETLPIEKIQTYKEQDKKYKIHYFNSDREDCEIEVFETDEIYAKTAIPLFASYITSYARIRLLEAFLKNKELGILYCDTDSIVVRSPNFTPELLDNKELGKFKLETKLILEIRGCKNYDYAEINQDGFFDTTRRIKGIPKKAVEISENEYQYYSMNKTLGSLRRNNEAGEFEKRKKKIGNIYDKRKVESDGNTTAHVEIITNSTID